MAKGIIVVDVPKNCKECEYRLANNFCIPSRKDIFEFALGNKKPDWCPIQKIPKDFNEEMLKFLQGEWVECEVVQKALGMDFKQCFAVFDFCRSAEWWSIVGKTEKERSREGQKITACFRIKERKRDEK